MLNQKIEHEFVDIIRRHFINRNISPCLSENVKPSPNEKIADQPPMTETITENPGNCKAINEFFKPVANSAVEGKGDRKASLGYSNGVYGLINELDSRDKQTENVQTNTGTSDKQLEKSSNEGE